MSKKFKKILSALLTSTVIASVASAGASVVSAKTAYAEEAIPGSNYTAGAGSTDSQEAVYEFSPPTGSSDKVGEFSTIGYKHTVRSLEDYTLALKRTSLTNEELRKSLDAAAKTDVKYVDNTKNKYFPKIGNQGNVGSCVAWSCIYYQFTNAINKMLDREATDANTFQAMFLYNIYNGCNMPRHIENLLYTTGCAPVSMVSDTQNNKTWSAEYKIWREAANYRICDYICFDTPGDFGLEISSPDDPDLAAIKAALRDGDVLSYAGPINNYQREKMVAAPGVPDEIVGEYIATECYGDGIANHMMTIVGYNDNIWVDHNKNGKIDKGELGALKIANQYGEDAYKSSKGCFWISYDVLNKRSVVEGATNNPQRSIPVCGPVKWVVSKAHGSSGIFLKYTMNSDNRTDSYIEVTAKRNSDGMTYTRKITPYFYSDYQNASGQRLNYKGTTGYCDGSMASDLNLVVEDLNSDNFNDYTWRLRFVDVGRDSSYTEFKEAVIVDDNTGKQYQVNTQFPFTLNKSEKTASFKPYYNFSKLHLPAASTITVGSKMKFTFKTANETFGSTPIKYTMTITQNGKKVFSKQHKATTVYKSSGSSVIKGSWTPTKTGKYTVTISGTDAAGKTAKRSAEFTVYNKKLAVRSINIDKGKYVDMCDKIKITPKVTGGKAPYTYSYYYIKGGKTIKLAENTKNAYKSKTFVTNSGAYKFLVKVKDAEGNVAQATQYVVVTPARISKMNFSKLSAAPGENVSITSEVSYVPGSLGSLQYAYTAEKDGKTVTISTSGGSTVSWTPQEAGEYNVTVKALYNGKTMAKRTEKFKVSKESYDGRIKINVNVITYVYDETHGNNFKLHYWGGNNTPKDADCVALNTKKTKNVGFWDGARTFHQYVAYIPADATGFKFHIGGRWFPATGGDGETSKQNTVYVFKYDYDRCLYTKE